MAIVAWAGLALGLLNLAIVIVNLQQQQQPRATVLVKARRTYIGGHWDLRSAEIVVVSTGRQAITLDDLALHVFVDNRRLASSHFYSAYAQDPSRDLIFGSGPERRIEAYGALNLTANISALRELTRQITNKEAIALQAVATRHKRRSGLPGMRSATATYRSELVQVDVPDS